LPDLVELGKKVPSDEYILDLINRNRGSGQVLDKNQTIKNILATNILLGNITEEEAELAELLVAKRDFTYRTLDRQIVYKSLAAVFFMRDYSISMHGKAAATVVAQQIILYSWLMYVYKQLVIPFFILHDTEAKQVHDFETYYKENVGGGTRVYTAFELANQVIEKMGLAKNYNIYVFYGTDGEDFDNGTETIAEIQKMFPCVNRLGVEIVRHPGRTKTEVGDYLNKAGLINESNFCGGKFFRMHELDYENATEEDNIEAVKALIK
jgi:uncharacterized sporulation protein YeaH/YhbH (DUF444 family)